METLEKLANSEDGPQGNTKEIFYEGIQYNNTPRVRHLIKRAKVVKSKLPPPDEEMTRLWRGNRPGGVGQNPTFTNSLVGIALPFKDMYNGELSYVDVPTERVREYLSESGVAPNSEFVLPPDLAKKARIAQDPLQSVPVPEPDGY